MHTGVHIACRLLALSHVKRQRRQAFFFPHIFHIRVVSTRLPTQHLCVPQTTYPGQEIDVLGEQLDNLGDSLIGFLHRGMEAWDTSPPSSSPGNRRSRRVIPNNGSPSKTAAASARAQQEVYASSARGPGANTSPRSASSSYKPTPRTPSTSVSPPAAQMSKPQTPSPPSSRPQKTAGGAASPSSSAPRRAPHTTSTWPDFGQLLSGSPFDSSSGRVTLPNRKATGGEDIESQSHSNVGRHVNTDWQTHADGFSDGYASSSSSNEASKSARSSTLESLASQQSTPKMQPEETENRVFVCRCGKEYGCSCKHRISILCGYAESQVRKASSWKLKDQVEL